MGRPYFTHTAISDDSALGGTTIQKSLRFNRTDTPYLQTTLGNSNVDKWTWSGWVKKTINEQHQNIFSSGSDSVYTIINFDNNDKLKFQNWHSAQKGTKITTRVFRDNSAWMHIVVIWDSGNSTADDRIRIYINGTRETSFSSSSNPDQNQDSVINGNTLGGSTYGEGKHFIGKFADTSDHSGTYKTEINFVDGYAYDPSYFGYTDFQTKLWRPKRYTGSYGTNGFHLNFLNNDTFTNFTDTSSSARTITRNGNVIHKSDQTKNGATSIYFDGSGDSLTVPDSSDFHVAGNDFTIEAYIRRTSQGNDEWFFVQSEGTTSNTSIGLHIGSSSSGYANKPSLRYTVGGSGNELTGTTALAANTWYHIAGVRNGNTLRIYVNGTQEASTSFSGTITDASTRVIIGAVNSAGSAGLTGYVDQVRWSNSCRYPDGTSFTAPTAQFTADSNTKLLVQSNVTKTLGSDSSGNGNDFTPNNFATADSTLDTPTNVFCTFNALDNRDNLTLSEGNLKATGAASWDQIKGTMGVSSGKWYFEIEADAIGTTAGWFGGIHELKAGANYVNTYWSQNIYTVADYGYVYAVQDDNRAATNTSEKSFTSNITAGDIVGFRVDLDNNELSISVNGSDKGKVYDIQAGITYTPAVNMYASGTRSILNCGQDSTFAGAVSSGGNADANGIGDFKYAVPSGYKAICSNNLLPNVPSIYAKKHFDTILYTGNGGTQSITGLEFRPDFVWLKSRSQGYHHRLFDAVRGVGTGTNGKSLRADSNGAEENSDPILTAFDQDGFFLSQGSYQGNASGVTYAAWCWRAGSPETPTNGSIFCEGSTDHIRVAGNSDLDFGTGNFTIEGFFNTEKDSNSTIIASKDYYTAGTNGNWLFRITNASSFGFASYDGNSNEEYSEFSFTYSKRRWYHFAIVREGTGTNQVKVYIDGNSIGTMTVSKSLSAAGSGTGLGIGEDISGTNSEFQGHISNIRIIKGTALYTSNFTPPSSPLTNVTNTKLLCCQSTTSVTAAAVTPSSITAHGSVRIDAKNPFDAFSKDGVGYSSTSAAGITEGNNALTGALVNTSAGFSILHYIGNGTNNSNITMGHGLGKKPGWILIKNRTRQANWVSWVEGIGGSATDNQKNLELNSSVAAQQNSSQFRYADSSTIAVRDVDSNGNNKVNRSGDSYVAYCWAEIPGFSKFGIYKGNGSTNGSFVYTGFTPIFIIYRKVASENWHMFDTKRKSENVNATVIDPNRDAAETTDTNTQIDILSNGFKLRSSHGTSNANNTDYFYMAFADQSGSTAYDTEANAR